MFIRPPGVLSTIILATNFAMGPVLVAYVTFESLFIRLENKFEAKALQSSGRATRRWRYAQMLRIVGEHITRDKRRPEYILWVQNMIDLDIRLREIVQREDFLINQCEKADKLLNHLNKQQEEEEEEEEEEEKQQQEQLDKWHTELRNLGQSYGNVERMLCANDMNCPVGPSWRGYLSLRKFPQWYLTPWLIEDCVRRGGCWGRM